MPEHIPSYYQLKTNAAAAAQAVVRLGPARFTILSERMVRMEYHPQARFEDRPSQVVWHRQQPVPAFIVEQGDGRLVIQTAALRLSYQTDSAFAKETLEIEMLGTRKTWRYGMEQKENLLGTTRTLDMANGAVPLEPGLLSRRGWTVVDDSTSLVFNDQGWLEARPPGGTDLYFWAYGTDYRLGMAEYYRVAGKPGLVPRWALGNWWSRYWEYTAETLRGVVEEFQAHDVPLGVCIIDMDWHLTQTGNACTGWTGYTWNKQLFPDPPGFIRWLHEMGLKTGLNLHPAEGIWPHEAKYPEMAQAMGIDPASGQPVRFEIEDPAFVNAYFEHLHHPKEAEGVDFWWMDWQQGNPSSLPGLNLLWWINHLHYLDAGRSPEKRPFLFSRWGGLGNHRYPIGFSGDTFVSWEALSFQPYMTATAANVGYSWWSHDIGGHMGGSEDGELYTRWVQFGAFSPILRVHSTKNAYHERRPWGFDANVQQAASAALRLRHRLIPYLYSMAWKDHTEGSPLVRPLYYLDPERDEAYASPQTYAFGSELVAAPFTTPIDPNTRQARQVVWLPGEGSVWYGLFNSRIYRGGNWHAVYGGLQDIPVFAKAGAIVPLAPETGWGGIDLPDRLELHFFPGASNRFELFEDDGVSQAYQAGEYATTLIETSWDRLPGDADVDPRRLRVRVSPAQGATGLLPAQRTWMLVLHAVQPDEPVLVFVNGERVKVEAVWDAKLNCLRLGEVSLSPADVLTMEVFCRESLPGSDLAQEVVRLVEQFPLETETRGALVERAAELVEDPYQLADFAAGLEVPQLRALLETLTGAGLDFQRAGGKQAPARVVAWNSDQRPEIGFLYSAERNIIFLTGLRYTGSTELEGKCRIFLPNAELGDARAVWALSYGSVLRVEERYG